MSYLLIANVISKIFRSTQAEQLDQQADLLDGESSPIMLEIMNTVPYIIDRCLPLGVISLQIALRTCSRLCMTEHFSAFQ